MLADFSYEEMKIYAKVKNLPTFRGEQIFEAILGAKTLEGLSRL